MRESESGSVQSEDSEEAAGSGASSLSPVRDSEIVAREAMLDARLDDEWFGQRDLTPEPHSLPSQDFDGAFAGLAQKPLACVPRQNPVLRNSLKPSKHGRCHVHPQCLLVPHLVKKRGCHSIVLP